MKGVILINEIFSGIRENNVLITALWAWLVAQTAKTVIWGITKRQLNFRRLVEPGGMPSAHSAFVTSLATGVGLYEGWSSPVFALAAVFSLIVMYDAAGVRRAAGKQAKVLNQIVEDLGKREVHPDRLRELIGHTPVEVIVGAVYGILFAYWLLS